MSPPTSNPPAPPAAAADVRVRPATPADAPVLAEFNARMAMETESLALDRATLDAGVRAGLADPTKARYFVADVGGTVAGQLMLTLEWSDWRNGEIWWIQSVYVAPGHRKRGLFRLLYEHVRDLARAKGAAGLRLYVERDNRTAQDAYARLGMTMTHYAVMEQMLK